jgi:hypothetical protein
MRTMSYMTRAAWTRLIHQRSLRPCGLPLVQGVAPELAVGREVVRRDAGDVGGDALGVELEEVAVGPHVTES